MAFVWPAVAAIFLMFSQPLEGTIYHLYADKDGNVTAATGYLADPLPRLIQIRFVHVADGRDIHVGMTQKPTERSTSHPPYADESGADPFARRHRSCRFHRPTHRLGTQRRTPYRWRSDRRCQKPAASHTAHHGRLLTLRIR